jgi:hypothetical protein
MDPWLEDFEHWPDIHKSLIMSIRDTLAPMVRPRFFVGVSAREVVLNGTDQDLIETPDAPIDEPDFDSVSRLGVMEVMDRVEARPSRPAIRRADDRIEEIFLVMKEVPSRRPVTVIEVLSPTNKKTKGAREKYLNHRHRLMGSNLNYVEIDLLRAGPRMPLSDGPPRSDYRILVYRPKPFSLAEVHPFSCRDPIPGISIPLLPGEPEPTLDLNGILQALLDRVRYDLQIDYRQPPSPRLRKKDQPWAATIVAQVAADAPHNPAGGDSSP